MTFYPERIKAILDQELPFMTTEAILMDLAQKGYDRQEMHEIIKKHSVATGLFIKEEGGVNDLFTRLGDDPKFPLSEVELDVYLEDPARYAGAAIQQTEEYLEVIAVRLASYEDVSEEKRESEINV